MRKSIFEIAAETIDIKSEVERIFKIFKVETTLCVDSYDYKSICKFVDEYCFGDWSKRGHFINTEDFLQALDFYKLKTRAANDSDSLLTFIELIYNFWYLTYLSFDNELFENKLEWCGNYFHLQELMDDILQQYNHKAYINDAEECVLVVEDKEEVTAVAEILPSQLSYDVIKYNHIALKGDIELKKSILIKLGSELEPKRKELKAINKKLEDDIFFMLNNSNIRHNNRSKKEPAKYKEYIAKMNKNQLEKWYDELYQMILLAFLLLDNEERTEKIKELKAKINGGSDNG